MLVSHYVNKCQTLHVHFIYIHVHNCRISLLLGKKNNYYEPVMPLKLQHTYSDHHLFSPGSVILK